MFQRTVRLLFGPIGRKLIVLMALAAAWSLWWVWPARPVRRVQFSGTAFLCNIHLVNGTYVAFVEPTSMDTPREMGWRLLRLTDGAVLASGPRDSICEISPSADCIVLDDHGRLVRIDAATGREQKRTASIVLPSSEAKGPLRSMRFCKSGSRIAIEDEGLKVFDTSSLELVAQFPNASGKFGLSCGGRLLATQESETNLFALWNVDTHERVGSIVDESVDVVYDIGISPRGDFAFVSGKQRSQGELISNSGAQVYVWDLTRFAKVGEFASFDAVARFSDDGRFLFLGRANRSAIVDLDSVPPRNLIQDMWPNIEHHAVTPDGQFTLAVDEENNWWLWSIRENRSLADGIMSGERALLFDLSPDGQWWWSLQLIVDSPPSKLNLWLLSLTGRSIPQNSGVVLRHSTTGRTINVGQAYPIYWDTTQNKVWTARLCHNDDTPGGRDTILEQWSLQESHSIWWMWLLAVAGLASIIIDFKRQASRGRKSPVAA
jgi:hypothetical protein